MLTLYPDQQRNFDELRRAFAQYRSVLFVAPTGFGKTAIGCQVAHGAAAKGTRTAFLVHREELIDQTCAAFDRAGVEYGVIAAGHPKTDATIQVAMVGTLVNRDVPDFGLLVYDEAHHCAANTWKKISQRFPDARALGLTATPLRRDGKGLGDTFDYMVTANTPRELIQMGRLSPYHYFGPEIMDLSGLRKSGTGDYSRPVLERAMADRSITGNAIHHYRSLCDGAPFLAFCVSVEHARRVAAEFRDAGYPVEAVDGSMDKHTRRGIVRELCRSLVGVTSCDLISEGFDAPAVVAGLFLRPTASLGLCMQQWGRCLRVAPGKSHAMLLDCVGNYTRHLFPDTHREWVLTTDAAVRKTKTVDAPAIRHCPKCHAVHEWAPDCPYCGHHYEVERKKELKQRKGELTELTPAEMERIDRLHRAAKESGQYVDWAAYAKATGRKPYFAYCKAFKGKNRRRKTA